MPDESITPIQLRALLRQRDGLVQTVTNLELQYTVLQMELQEARQELDELKREPKFREAAE